MNFQVTLSQSGKVLKTVTVSVEEGTPVVLKGELAPAGSPFPAGHPLLIQQGKDLVLQVAAGMDAALVRAGKTLKLADLRTAGHAKKSGNFETLPFPEGASAQVTLGGWTIAIEAARAAATAPAPVRAPGAAVTTGGAISADIWAQYRIFSETARVSTFMRVAMVSLVIHISIMVFFATRVIVHDPFEVVEIPERFAKFLAPPEEKPKPEAVTPQTQQVKTEVEDTPAEAEKAAGDEGKLADNKPAGAKSDDQKRAEMKEKVKRTGLLAIIGSSGSGGALKDVLSEGSLSGDLDKALENMKGSGLGVAKTGEDLKAGGTRGGSGYGTADIGALKTGGTGRGVGLGTKTSTDVKSEIATGEITSSGSLDASAIASVVKSKISGIKYCYEKELKNNPKLAGKVIVNFTIGETGEVTSYAVENSTINNAEVEQCILRMIRRWKFPAPNGGTVNVSYPFIFTAQG